MGMPAVRIADPTNCGGIVILGFPTVLIGKIPASRLTDLHTCITLLFVPTPITFGSPTVLIGALPAARANDQCTDNTIAMGCPTVLIGP